MLLWFVDLRHAFRYDNVAVTIHSGWSGNTWVVDSDLSVVGGLGVVVLGLLAVIPIHSRIPEVRTVLVEQIAYGSSSFSTKVIEESYF